MGLSRTRKISALLYLPIVLVTINIFNEAIAEVRPLLNRVLPKEQITDLRILIGKWEEAVRGQLKQVAELTKAIKDDPTDASCTMERAEVYMLLNEKDKALEDINRYIR
jgi:thioredoxin-like negative regulator of GroEL